MLQWTVNIQCLVIDKYKHTVMHIFVVSDGYFFTGKATQLGTTANHLLKITFCYNFLFESAPFFWTTPSWGVGLVLKFHT